jgi:ribosomal protein S16
VNLPNFSPPTDAERTWIRDQLEGVLAFVGAYSPEDAGKPVTLAILDRAWAAWLVEGAHGTDEVNAAINVVGIRFGQFLVDEAGFQWVIATDEHGTDLAVLALPRRGDVLVYPANFVAKRCDRRETNFLAAAFDAIIKQVAEIASASSVPPRRPWWRRT